MVEAGSAISARMSALDALEAGVKDVTWDGITHHETYGVAEVQAVAKCNREHVSGYERPTRQEAAESWNNDRNE